MRKLKESGVRRLLPWSLLFLLFSFLPARPVAAGGWATFTLLYLPESPRAGAAINLDFVARAHGQAPFHFTRGEAEFFFRNLQTGKTITVAVTPATHTNGLHKASVILPSAGEWEWALHPGGYPILKLQTLTALPRAQDALIERGKALFAAKGCVTCHRNDKIGDQWTVEIGPNLTAYRNDSLPLAAWLANPSAIKPGTTMPALGLQPAEIDALVAFLLTDAPATAQR